MKNSAARRFAKALIELGKEENKYDQFGKELRAAFAVFKGSPELYKVLLNPMYKLDLRKGIMEKVSESLKLSPYVGRFFNILVETRNVRLLEDIIAAYSRLEDELAGRLRATLEAPVEPDALTIESIKEKLAKATGKQVTLTCRNNPSLLGGLVLRIDNTILDGSLRTQLDLMKEKIMEGVV